MKMNTELSCISQANSRYIILPTKICIVKVMIFPVVIFGCESWTIKKAECQRIDAFELWCWRRLLRVPWATRRSNQSILKEISPGCSLEGLTDAEAESPLATWCVEPTHWKRPQCWERLKAGREGATGGEMVGWHHWLNGHEFEQAVEVGNGQGSLACCSLWGGQESGITKWLNNSRMDQLGCVPCLFCLGYQCPPLGACLSPSFPPEDRLPLLYVLVPPGPFLHHMGFVIHTHLLHKVRLEPHCQCPQMVIVAALSFHHCYPLLHLMT